MDERPLLSIRLLNKFIISLNLFLFLFLFLIKSLTFYTKTFYFSLLIRVIYVNFIKNHLHKRANLTFIYQKEKKKKDLFLSNT